MEAAVDERLFELKEMDADEDHSPSIIDAQEVTNLIGKNRTNGASMHRYKGPLSATYRSNGHPKHSGGLLADEAEDDDDRDEIRHVTGEDGASSPADSVEIIDLCSQEAMDVTPPEEAMEQELEADDSQLPSTDEELFDAPPSFERAAKRRATSPPEALEESQSLKKPPVGAITLGASIVPVSAPDDGNGGPAAKKRRFAAVRKSAKCGICDNCRNPHWKKACIEVRKAQETGGQEPVQKTGIKTAPPSKPSASARPSTTPTAGADSAYFSEDRFLSSMGKIMASSGGVMHANHVPVLIDLMKRAGTWGQRRAVLSALEKSSSEVQKEVVRQKGLLTLQKWFSEAVEGKREKTLQNLMKALDALPMTLAALSPPCELGKLVGKLRKAEGMEAVRPQAQGLVTKWKAIVEKSNAAPIAKAAAVAATASAKAKATTAAADAKITAATDAAKKTKSASVTTAVATTTTSSLAPSVAAAGATPAASNKKRALGEDGDIFRDADKKRADAVARQHHTHEPATSNKPDNVPHHKPTLSSIARPSPIGVIGKSKSDLGPVRSTSSSLFATSSSLGNTFSAPPPLLSGAERARHRAKEAAARIPSPEPGPRKEKRKNVKWLDGESLEAIRWFRRADPPVAAQRDVDDSAPEAAPPSPPRFASAAKKEHLSEAKALKAHREQEDTEQAQFRERLELMRIGISWSDPPLIAAAVAAQHTIAAGEQSTEIAAAILRRKKYPPAVYLTSDAVPQTPSEPADRADRGRHQSHHAIARIPLSMEEARALQAQQTAAAAAAPPLPVFHQPQPHEAYYSQPQQQPQLQQQPPPMQQQQQQQQPPQQGFGYHQQEYLPPGYQTAPPSASAPAPGPQSYQGQGRPYQEHGNYGGGGQLHGGAPVHQQYPLPHAPQQLAQHPPPVSTTVPMTNQALPLQPSTVAPQRTAALPALPLDLSAAIAQLAASGALESVSNSQQQQGHHGAPQQQQPFVPAVSHHQQSSPQQHHQHHHHSHQHHQLQHQTQHHQPHVHQPPITTQGHGPPMQQQSKKLPPGQKRTILPPGLQPMLGLHRASQAQAQGSKQPHVMVGLHRPAQQAEQAQQAPLSAAGARPQGHQPGRNATACRFFNSPSGCKNGDNCRFAHVQNMALDSSSVMVDRVFGKI